MFKIMETWLNVTENYVIDSTDFYEPFTQDTDELFKALEEEYGKHTGEILMGEGNDTAQLGWIFEKTDYYTDTNEPYVKETWVELSDPSVFK